MSEDLFRAQTKAIEFWDNYKPTFSKRSTSKEDVTKVSFGIGYDIGRKEAEASVRELEDQALSYQDGERRALFDLARQSDVVNKLQDRVRELGEENRRFREQCTCGIMMKGEATCCGCGAVGIDFDMVRGDKDYFHCSECCKLLKLYAEGRER